MIITKKKDLQDIVKSLETTGAKSVHLFGCDSCAEQCKTGGPDELREMTENLTEKGYEVTGTSLIDETCYNQVVRKAFRLKPEIKESDAVLVLSCGAGVKTVADNADASQPVLPALDSTFLASVKSIGRFFQGCSLCGDCVLDKTAGVCPHTDCPKSLLNGPCGGVVNGKCEVYMENDCAWVKIYQRLEKQGRLNMMMRFQPPKDHSANAHPSSVLLR